MKGAAKITRVRAETYLEREVAGVSVEVVVTGEVTFAKGSGSYHAPSDLDYRGYIEVDDIQATLGGEEIDLTPEEEASAEAELIDAADAIRD